MPLSRTRVFVTVTRKGNTVMLLVGDGVNPGKLISQCATNTVWPVNTKNTALSIGKPPGT